MSCLSWLVTTRSLGSEFDALFSFNFPITDRTFSLVAGNLQDVFG